MGETLEEEPEDTKQSEEKEKEPGTDQIKEKAPEETKLSEEKAGDHQTAEEDKQEVEQKSPKGEEVP